jgi:hypothetical protein
MGLALAFVVGCGGKGDELYGEAKKITDELCACKDEACADAVREKRSALKKKARETFAKKEDVPEDLMKKMNELDDKWRECRDKIREASKENAAE